MGKDSKPDYNVFGMTCNEGQSKGICVKCKERASEKCYSIADGMNYQKYGLCSDCYYDTFEKEMN